MANKLFLLSALIVALCFVSHVVSQDSPAIRAALLDLYASTNIGPNGSWLRRQNWATSVSICQWQNIKCNPDGTSFSLDLRANGLYGTIPDSIGDFGVNITSLLLDENQLGGTIPDRIAELTNLYQLDLSENILRGDIPYGLEKITNLQLLWLSDNFLESSIPVDLEDILNQVVKYQATQGCRLSGNQFCCPVPGWVPPECGMGCNGTEYCIESAKTTKIDLN